jgi:hypothetical protein
MEQILFSIWESARKRLTLRGLFDGDRIFLGKSRFFLKNVQNRVLAQALSRNLLFAKHL